MNRLHRLLSCSYSFQVFFEHKRTRKFTRKLYKNRIVLYVVCFGIAIGELKQLFGMIPDNESRIKYIDKGLVLQTVAQSQTYHSIGHTKRLILFQIGY